MKLPLRHILNFFVVIVLGVYIAVASGYNPQSRLMPLVVSIPIFLLALWQTFIDLRSAGGLKDGKRGIKTDDNGLIARECKVLLWVFSLFISLYLFGFIITTFLYTFLSLKVRSRLNLGVSLGVSGGALAFVYLVLIWGFNVDLYQGSVVLLLRKMLYGY